MRLVAVVGLVAVALLAGAVPIPAQALTSQSSSVSHIGAGAARLTTFTNGTGSLFVNLKGLSPGTWNEHLWTGTCSSLGSRVAVLQGLAVPAIGSLSRTNPLTIAQAKVKTLRIVRGTAVLCATFGVAAAPLTPTGFTEPATVVRVVDGDTIVVDRGTGQESLRYIGVDTPETVHPTVPLEWMGNEASAFNRLLVEGRQIVLERDISDVDQYGRLLRYVWIQDGTAWTFVNLELLKAGFAQVSTYPPDVKYVDAYLGAQRTAREQGTGLWGTSPATPMPSATPGSGNCHPSYPTVCIPPPPPDLDCGQISARRFTVTGTDPHRFDGDNDGIGCEA